MYLPPWFFKLAHSNWEQQIQAKDWVRKLSKSILKKISEGSKTAFAGQGEILHRRHCLDLVFVTKILVLFREQRWRYSAENRSTSEENRRPIQPPEGESSQSNSHSPSAHNSVSATLSFGFLLSFVFSFTCPPLLYFSEERAYSSGLYEAQCQSIQDKVQRLSEEINVARSAMEDRLSTMEKTVGTVRDNIDVYMKYAPLPGAQSSAPASGAVPSTSSTTSTTATVRNQTSQPAPQTTTSQPTSSTNNNNNTSNNNNHNNQHGSGRKRSHVAGSNQHDPLHKMAAHLR